MVVEYRMNRNNNFLCSSLTSRSNAFYYFYYITDILRIKHSFSDWLLIFISSLINTTLKLFIFNRLNIFIISIWLRRLISSSPGKNARKVFISGINLNNEHFFAVLNRALFLADPNRNLLL